MNIGDSSGESSSGGRENGASSLDTERPHKKARFPWQIKGKHHLKSQANELTISPNIGPAEPEPETSRAESVIPPTNADVPISNKKPIECNTSNLSKGLDMDTSTQLRLLGHGPPLPLETVISLAETMLLNAEKEGIKVIRTDIIRTKPKEDTSAGPSKAAITARDVRRMRREEERCISRWQAAQTVKGCFDNTINRVLESWMNAPAAPEERFLALDFARIMNELPPNDDNVENEGILMAINAHGLQNVAGAPDVPAFPLIAPNSALAAQLASDVPICEDSDSSLCSEDFEIPTERESGSPWPSDELNTSNQNQPSSNTHDNRNAVRPDPYHFDNHPTPGEDYNEYEFLNSAVIQAIKSKGLMAAGTDFG